jgi:hypothetical protein
MPPTASKADKAAAEQAEKVAAEGLYAATEGDDNSVAVSDDAFIGVSDEYKNYANESDRPLKAEEGREAEIEEQQAAHEAEILDLSKKVNPLSGYDTSDTPHPSEKVKPQDAYIEGNRALMEDAVAERKGNDDEQGTTPFPSSDSGSTPSS